MNSSEENLSSQTTKDLSKLEPLKDLIDLLLEPDSLPNDSREFKSYHNELVLEDSEFKKKPSILDKKNLDDSLATKIDGELLDLDSQYPDEVKAESQTRSTLDRAVEPETFLRQKILLKSRPPEELDRAVVGTSLYEVSSSEPQRFVRRSESRAKQEDETNTANGLRQRSASKTGCAVESSSNTKENQIDLEQLELDLQSDPQEIIEVVNSLIPLIVELLQSKLEDSQTEIIKTVKPVIDRLIEERIAEDSQKMAAAIAPILPSAISKGIDLTPEAIAKAIAPEIALSIAEQIRLDENSISQTLGPEMGKAIKAQIELERDAMVDALYPVIGSTISKYMVEVVRDINEKVESTLSPQGIKRKIRAKIQGVSEAELIFQESVGYRVRAMFLIAKDSGLVIQEIQQPGEQHLDSDTIAGMLTAIRSFANDCITSGLELDTIDYGNWQILLEVAGYCYLAVVVRGEPTKQFRNQIRQVLGEIVLKYGNLIEHYDGNLANVPPEIKTKLEQLIPGDGDESSKSSPILLWLLIFLLGAIFVPWGIINYRARMARQIERTAAVELDAAPELSVYRLVPEVSKGKLTVTGRVPSQYLRDRAATIVEEIAEQKDLLLNNKIVTVDVPVDANLLTGEVERLTELFDRQPEIAIKTSYQLKTLTVTGFISNPDDRQRIARAFSNIPGVERVILNLKDLPTIEQRIYFESGEIELNFADNINKIDAVKRLLVRYPRLHLKLFAHSDGLGLQKFDRELGKKRCQTVKTALVARGIEPKRVINRCDLLLLPANTSDQATWTNRYVGFEPFVPTNLP